MVPFFTPHTRLARASDGAPIAPMSARTRLHRAWLRHRGMVALGYVGVGFCVKDKFVTVQVFPDAVVHPCAISAASCDRGTTCIRSASGGRRASRATHACSRGELHGA